MFIIDASLIVESLIFDPLIIGALVPKSIACVAVAVIPPLAVKSPATPNVPLKRPVVAVIPPLCVVAPVKTEVVLTASEFNVAAADVVKVVVVIPPLCVVSPVNVDAPLAVRIFKLAVPEHEMVVPLIFDNDNGCDVVMLRNVASPVFDMVQGVEIALAIKLMLLFKILI